MEELEQKLDQWLDSNEHALSCAAWNEGLLCCLDKDDQETIYGTKGREFIIELFKQQAKAIRKQAIQECIEKLEHADEECYGACCGIIEQFLVDQDDQL